VLISMQEPVWSKSQQVRLLVANNISPKYSVDFCCMYELFFPSSLFCWIV
jgi:hypothetical protein